MKAVGFEDPRVRVHVLLACVRQNERRRGAFFLAPLLSVSLCFSQLPHPLSVSPSLSLPLPPRSLPSGLGAPCVGPHRSPPANCCSPAVACEPYQRHLELIAAFSLSFTTILISPLSYVRKKKKKKDADVPALFVP